MATPDPLFASRFENHADRRRIRRSLAIAFQAVATETRNLDDLVENLVTSRLPSTLPASGLPLYSPSVWPILSQVLDRFSNENGN